MKDSSGSGHMKHALGAGLVSLAAYHLLMRYFFPNQTGKVGHDYSYFLPRLLDGEFWRQENGLFSIPWFTPSFFTGVPCFGNPQGMFHSLPQALTGLMDPLSAVYITILTFALIGFAGFYALLAWRFHLSPSVCAYGAFLFMFNGFYMTRMIAGHLGFHSFMLTPWMVFLLLPSQGEQQARQSFLARIRRPLLAAFLFAYMAHAGGLALAPIMITAILLAGLLSAAIYGGLMTFTLNLAAAGAVSLALSASKLAASASFLANFPKEYPIAGAGDIFGVLHIAASSLFMPTDGKVVNEALSHKIFFPGPHEFDYSISPAPALFILFAVYITLREYGLKGLALALSRERLASALAAMALLLMPLVLNYYSPVSVFLSKNIPLLKFSNTFLRWFAILIPALIILAALSLEKFRIFSEEKELWIVAALVVFTIASSARNWEYYAKQGYHLGPVTAAYLKLGRGKTKPEIRHAAIMGDKKGKLIRMPHYSSSVIFAYGSSPIYAYEPAFGYRLERFPFGNLVPGPVMNEKDGLLNMKNPACFSYPAANGCKPGDHFTAGQREQAELFRKYKPFGFQFSAGQVAANWVSLASIPVCLVLLFISWGREYAFRLGWSKGE